MKPPMKPPMSKKQKAMPNSAADTGPASPPPGTLVQVGRVGKPHGLDGTVKVIPETDDPERFSTFETVYIGRDADHATAHTVTQVRFQPHKRGTTVLLTVASTTDRTAAEALRRTQVYVPESALHIPEGMYHMHDLIGWAVYDADTEAPLGTLTAIMPLPGPDALVIQTESGHEALVPFVEDLVPHIDDEAERLYVQPIEGLLDANESDAPAPPAA